MLWDEPAEWDVGCVSETKEGGDICILIADSCCCPAET